MPVSAAVELRVGLTGSSLGGRLRLPRVTASGRPACQCQWVSRPAGNAAATANGSTSAAPQCQLPRRAAYTAHPPPPEAHWQAGVEIRSLIGSGPALPLLVSG